MPNARPSARLLQRAWVRWGPVAVLGAVVLVLLVVLAPPAGIGSGRLEPVQVGVSTDDPLTFAVGVRWPSGGTCPGELRPVVREQRDRVVVRWVERRTDGRCAGAGVTAGTLVYGELHLLVPLGRRLVVTGEGRQLPVVTLSS